MNWGFYIILLAQFLSALADNALLFTAIALLRDMQAPSWHDPLLQWFFVISYIILAPFVGAFADAQTHDLVLLDLPGLPGRQNLDTWLREVSGGNLPACHVHLVLSPLFGSSQMDMFVSRLRSDSAASIIWTKLDEACNYGEIINQANNTGLPVSLFSVGPDLKNTLVQPKDQDVWRLLLRHELPEATN